MKNPKVVLSKLKYLGLCLWARVTGCVQYFQGAPRTQGSLCRKSMAGYLGMPRKPSSHGARCGSAGRGSAAFMQNRGYHAHMRFITQSCLIVAMYCARNLTLGRARPVGYLPVFKTLPKVSLHTRQKQLASSNAKNMLLKCL